MKLSLAISISWMVLLAMSVQTVSAFSFGMQTLTTPQNQVHRDSCHIDREKQQSLTPSDAASKAITTFLLSATLSISGLVHRPLPAAARSLPPTTDVLETLSGDVQGIGAVTQSKLGQSVRGAVIGGAQIADSLDLQWERFSDKLRDENKCDPRTNRRMFDNGTRKDGTKIGNPVLGALCTPEPLKDMDDSMVTIMTRLAEDAVLEVMKGTTAEDDRDSRQKLNQAQAKVAEKVGPAFARAASRDTETPDEEPAQTQNKKRQDYNRDLYIQMRTYGETLATTQGNKFQKFEIAWGGKMIQELAPTADRKDYSSPFPKPDPTDEQPYDEASLLDALGRVSVVLNKLQAAGIVGHWEISIPEDDYWNVVTIAVDDDVAIGGEILARESKLPLSGSPVVGLTKAAMEGAKIPYKMDVFFIDPTTTKQELYNPSQLLISLSDLGQ